MITLTVDSGSQGKVDQLGLECVVGVTLTLHETITRNHQCKNMDDLLEQVYYFMDTAAPFPGGKHGLKQVYHN